MRDGNPSRICILISSILMYTYTITHLIIFSMEVNFIAIMGMTVLAVIIGSIWYEPYMFGKLWMQFNGHMDSHGKMLITKEEMKRLQKESAPLYAIQAVLTFITFTVLYVPIHFIGNGTVSSDVISGGTKLSLMLSFFLWLGFIMPIQVGGELWSSTLSKKMKAKKCAIQAGYQLIIMLIAAFIFSHF